jgi:hypothetical protein
MLPLVARAGLVAALLALTGIVLMSAGPTEPPTPADSPLRMNDVMSSPLYRGLMTAKLRVGDPAAPFRLPLLDLRHGEARPTGKSVTLASFKGKKPVALIFGSYT